LPPSVAFRKRNARCGGLVSFGRFNYCIAKIRHWPQGSFLAAGAVRATYKRA